MSRRSRHRRQSYGGGSNPGLWLVVGAAVMLTVAVLLLETTGLLAV